MQLTYGKLSARIVGLVINAGWSLQRKAVIRLINGSELPITTYLI